MTNDEADGGVHESVAANMRAAAVMAMQVGERLAKAWTGLARNAALRATAEAAQIGARIEAERATAVAALTAVERPGWWEHGTAADVAGMVETAATWTDRDPAAARAMVTIEREVQDRYGLTSEALRHRTKAGDDHAEAIEAVTAVDALDRAAAHQTHALVDGGHLVHGEEHSMRGAAEQVHAGADSCAATTVREVADAVYDSVERREQFAVALEGSAEPDQVAGRIRADVNFAHPAEQVAAGRATGSATRGRPGSVPDRPRQRPVRGR